DQRRAQERIPHLLRVPARVRFLSMEPLLEAVDLRPYFTAWAVRGDERMEPARRPNWIIVGGESGSRARPFNLAWARSIVQQCADAGVPAFVKQMGDHAV